LHRCDLHEKIYPKQLQPGELDLEVGPGVAFDVAIDDGLVVGGAGHVVDPFDELGRRECEIASAAPDERLVAGRNRVGVDGRQVDLILPDLKSVMMSHSP
jgi:hypothetical protein